MHTGISSPAAEIQPSPGWKTTAFHREQQYWRNSRPRDE